LTPRQRHALEHPAVFPNDLRDPIYGNEEGPILTGLAVVFQPDPVWRAWVGWRSLSGPIHVKGWNEHRRRQAAEVAFKLLEGVGIGQAKAEMTEFTLHVIAPLTVEERMIATTAAEKRLKVKNEGTGSLD
jgi:hypothetical protein